MDGVRWALAITMTVAVAAAPSTAAATRLVVFPFKGEGVTGDRLEIADSNALAALQAIPGITAIGSAKVSEALGFDLGRQAAECANDLLCLVQIGEVIEAGTLLIGDLRDTPTGAIILRLSVIDVARATLVDTLRWEIPPRSEALAPGVAAACKRLFAETDATIVLKVFPRDAVITFYGERATEQDYGVPVPYWSGVYYGKVTRNGYEPEVIRIEVPTGGPREWTIELERDPLWVGAKTPRKPRTDRDDRPLQPPPDPGDAAASPLANYWAWGLIAAGVGGGVTGAVLMMGAQDDYNALAAEQRYAIGETTPWDVADETRTSSQDSFSLGATVLYVGAGVAAAGVVWMILDAALRTRKPEKVSSYELSRAFVPTIGTDGGGLAFEGRF